VRGRLCGGLGGWSGRDRREGRAEEKEKWGVVVAVVGCSMVQGPGP
jgi:hypothetical protein